MKQKKDNFEETYTNILARIEANSPYEKFPSKKATYMTAAEMGRLLGLKKTERYWLLHKHCFEWEEIMGKFRINIASFEKWYANQIKYKKVTGEEPGLDLKKRTFSPREIAEMLGICESSAYDVINANNIETEIVDYWKRIPKDAFYKWYYSQTKYRIKEDRERDLAIESTTISMPEMARLLGVERSTVYSILKSSKYKDLFEMVIVAEQKRITVESFERFLKFQDKYTLDNNNNLKEILPDLSIGKEGKPYLTYEEAAVLANVSRSTIYKWADRKCFPVIRVMEVVKIPRQEFEQYIKKIQGGNKKHGINSKKKG